MGNRRHKHSPRGAEIGRRIRRLRDAWGWTQIDLAERAYVSRSTISQVERGYYVAPLPTLERIAAAFDVELDALTGDGDIEWYAHEIERRRAATTLYGQIRADAMAEVAQVFTSWMHQTDRMKHLPRELREQIKRDLEDLRRRAEEDLPGA